MTNHSLFDDLFSDVLQQQHLRQEAITYYEQCLFTQNGSPFEKFVQQQLISNPFHAELLYEVHNDLQQRLMALQEYHFDNRKRVVQALLNIYQVDISPLTPADQLPLYHLLSADTVLKFLRQRGERLSKEEEHLIYDMVETSTSACAQLDRDIQLTEDLLEMVVDWLWATTLINVRESQDLSWLPRTDGVSRIH